VSTLGPGPAGCDPGSGPERERSREGAAERASSVYGPVHSWRYGSSLGIDLLLHRSVCSFACVYCQLGEIDVRTAQRAVFVPTAIVQRDLEASDWRSARVATFSGSGEPTLAANLGDAIGLVRRVSGLPVVVLTNAAHLWDPAVRAELADAAEVCCKLDAPDTEGLRAIDRPVDESLSIEKIVAGIAALRVEFSGRVSIQVMVLPRTMATLHRLVPLLASLRPHEVQLNVPSRPVPRARTLEARGAHREFGAGRAWRMIDRAELETIRERIELEAALSVRIPPAS
jgi:wyosine [tRNA(Phe)-imidazoG37] synthetase (radical SAM superfamily)